LSGANTYTGLTVVKGGTLRVYGQVSGSVTVEPGASLTGVGAVASTVDVSPGASIFPERGSVLALRGNVNLRGKLALESEVSGPGRIEVGGRLDLTGSSITLASGGALPDSPVHIIASYGTLVGKFNTGGLPSGHTIDYRYKGLNQIALLAPAAANHDER
ncbi:MAG: hypothetical protein EOP85_15965, partial [Verrucomicrobiaceae bacterium]